MRSLARIFLACVWLYPGIALTDEASWIVKENPDVLYVGTFAHSDCPISGKELEKLVKGVMIRSRIKPAESWGAFEPTLQVTVNCLPLQGNNPVFHSSVQFKKMLIDDNDDLLYIHRASDYGTIGIGEKSFITQSLKDSTEAAITEYLKANFDLGED